jgi:glycosyltransferase involved in cell wall biosynthesis
VDEIFIQVIDDGSKDQTAQVAKDAGADLVFSHPLNRGIGITFRTAVEKALENGADIMVNMDADGQFDAQDIQKLIQPILENRADLVSASRFGQKKADNMPKIKQFLNKAAAWVIGKFMDHPIADLTCGFRAYSREALLRLNLSGGFTYTQEVIIDAIGKNLQIEWVPTTVTYFGDRRSRVVKNIFHYVGNSGKIILKTVRDVRPMRFFGIPSLILIITSLFFFIYFLVLYLETLKITPYRNILLLAVTLFLIGIQILIFAFIADMIKSTRKSIEDQTYLIKKEKYGKH